MKTGTPGRKKAPIPDRDERLARGTTLIKGKKRLSLWVPVTGQNGRVWLHSGLAFCYPSFWNFFQPRKFLSGPCITV